MRLELEIEEAQELLVAIVDRIIAEAALSDADRAALRRWRSEALKAESEDMRDLAAKINADIDRALKTKQRSAIVKPDWR
ncbi:MAG TPA: hypothetical protein VGR43_02180 [Dehalococcoidia bacterium]|jgi:hypothetical protein|nr:hypothetical protein [Dehalococcoidia bacterium]